MAKRFTDTEKWKKSFVKGLPSEYKLLYFYITDECDHAGIWHVEMDLAELRLGIKLSKEKAQGLFNGKVVAFDNGNKWFLPDFIKFQYGELKETNKAHRSVIKILSKYNLLKFLNMENQGAIQAPKDKDKDIIVIIEGENFFLSKMRESHFPQPQEVFECFIRLGKKATDAAGFFNYYEGLGWKKGITPITSWAAFANRWSASDLQNQKNNTPPAPVFKSAQQLLDERK